MSPEPDTVRAYPHAQGPEKAVLSIMLQCPEMLHEAPSLTAEHFHLPGHRIMFGLIQELSAAGTPIDPPSFIQLLLDRGKLDAIGGGAGFFEVFNYEPVTEAFKAKSLRTYLEMLNDKLARRMTIAAAHEMERAAYEASDTTEIIEATSVPISAIHDVLTGTRPTRSTKAVLSACIDRFQLLCTGHADPMGFETSLLEINRRFRGLHGKQTVVISGYSGGGKTTLAGQLAMDAALDDHNALICSLEMPETTMMNRLLAYVARRPGDAITDPLR